MIINGIDVSKFQGNIDWNKVKASGIEFVMIRIGWTFYEGGLEIDSMFVKNIEGATKAGLKIGIYVYSYDKTPAAARISAKKVLEVLKSYKLTYPIAFDIEDERNYSYGKSLNSQIVKAFCDTIEEAKYYALVYTYTHFSNDCLDLSQLKKYDFWVADYRDKGSMDSQFRMPYGIWQYVGDKGKCDGVVGGCDRNYAYKDYAAIIEKAGLNNPVKAPVKTDAEKIAALEKEIEILNKNIRTAADESKKIEEKLKEAEKVIAAYEAKFQTIKTTIARLNEQL